MPFDPTTADGTHGAADGALVASHGAGGVEAPSSPPAPQSFTDAVAAHRAAAPHASAADAQRQVARANADAAASGADPLPHVQAATSRAWSALVVGLPGDGTLVVVDWLVLASALAGFHAAAVPVGGDARRPHGMYVEVAPADGADLLSGMPQQGVDLLVAGEHLELVRAIEGGFASTDATTIIASCHRSFSQAEHVVVPQHVLREREIDSLAERSSQRYVAFDGHEVAGWYRLSPAAQPALLFGAMCGAGVLGVGGAECETAIVQLGVDVPRSLQAFRRGLRMGRRRGGRVRRSLTASQFVRKRRSRLPRRERAGFEQLVERVEAGFDASHRPVLREAVLLLADYDSADYAAQLVELCGAVAHDERSALAAAGQAFDPARSVVPAVTRSLAGMMAYPDLPHVAHVKLGSRRLPELRRFHGIGRRDVYEVRDHIPIEEQELAQLRRRGQAAAAAASTPRPTLLGRFRVETITSTSASGAMRLLRLQRLRANRRNTERHALEMDLVDAYVMTVREALAIDQDLARLVADSGALVEGYGAMRAATRATAHAFWGRVVRPSFAIDRMGGDATFGFSRAVIPFVYDQVCRSGHLALWEYAGPVVGISLHAARGGTHADAIAFARALCEPRPLVADPPAPPPRPQQQERTLEPAPVVVAATPPPEPDTPSLPALPALPAPADDPAPAAVEHAEAAGTDGGAATEVDSGERDDEDPLALAGDGAGEPER